jgi:hypothetical protein
MVIDPNSVTAGRLMRLLTRAGDLRAAAELSETAIVSRPNLYSRLPQNPYIAQLKDELWLK